MDNTIFSPQTPEAPQVTSYGAAPDTATMPPMPTPAPPTPFQSAPPTPAPAPVAEPMFSPPPPPAPTPSASVAEQGGVTPLAVVQVLSPRGVEYVFLTIALFSGALGLGGALIAMVNGNFGFDVLSFPAALLLVAVPVFAALFLRLKKAELQDPSLRNEPSKRRSTQFTQIASFLVCFFTLVGFISALFAKMGGQYNGSLLKLFLDVLVVVLVGGGILFYYWRDEHRAA